MSDPDIWMTDENIRGPKPPEAHAKLAGLADTSMTITFDNSDASFLPTFDAIFKAQRPTTRVSYKVPDGRWQALKQRLARHWPLRWLKVRYVTYRFDAVAKTWDEAGIGFEAVGPVSKGLEER